MSGDGMRLMYGAPPAPGKQRHWPGDQNETFVPWPPTLTVDPPPPDADAKEIAAMAALTALDPAARKRILRWAMSKWGRP